MLNDVLELYVDLSFIIDTVEVDGNTRVLLCSGGTDVVKLHGDENYDVSGCEKFCDNVNNFAQHMKGMNEDNMWFLYQRFRTLVKLG